MCISELNYDELKKIYIEFGFEKPIDLSGFSQQSFLLLIKNIIYNIWKRSHPYFIKYKEIDLNFGYSSDKSINAGAFNCNNIDFICIHEGTVLALYNHFLKALKFKNLFREIFNNEEVFKRECLESEDTDGRDYAFLLATIGLMHISLHELGHHLDGHVLYDHNSGTSYCRRKYISNNNLISQSMEMDADAFACTNSLVETLEYFRNRWMFNLPSTLKYISSERSAVKLWMIAITSSFLILGKDGINIDNYNQADYFPIRVREFINADIVCKVIESIFPELYEKYDREEIEKDFAEAITISDTINCIVKGVNLKEEIKEANEQLESEILNHVQYIHDYWGKFKRELEPYARIPLYGQEPCN